MQMIVVKRKKGSTSLSFSKFVFSKSPPPPKYEFAYIFQGKTREFTWLGIIDLKLPKKEDKEI